MQDDESVFEMHLLNFIFAYSGFCILHEELSKRRLYRANTPSTFAVPEVGVWVMF